MGGPSGAGTAGVGLAGVGLAGLGTGGGGTVGACGATAGAGAIGEIEIEGGYVIRGPVLQQGETQHVEHAGTL